MTKIKYAWPSVTLPVAIGIAGFIGSANAASFNIGPITGQFDSQMSIGMSMSMADPDKRFIHGDTLIDGVNQGGQAATRTADDGRLNYEKGDIYSKIFKGSHDLELRYGNSGAFIRGNYWYDFETKDGSQRFYDISDSGRHPLQKGAGIQLLDAFVYHNYSIGDNQGNLRLGRQVVSWGEGVFIQNGINTINPIDASALRRPGAELKEGLLPVEMLYLSQALTQNLTLEAFYQLKWHGTIADNCGTFFSSNDGVGRGCNDRLVVAGPDMPHGEQPDQTFIARVRKDKEASDSGQFGVAFRWFVPELNNTEFGFYALNYHSRAPVYSSEAGQGATTGYDGSLGVAGYFMEHPEDIRLYGLSFGTDIGGTSVAGEISYRPNMPLQVNGSDMSRAASVLASGAPDNTHRNLTGLVAVGDYIPGYERKEFWQASVSALHFIERILGANRLALVGEIGANHIASIGSGNGTTKFGRDGLFGQSPFADGSCSSQGTTPRGDSWCENEGYFTDFSWGYRLRANLDYSSVIAGINLSPNIAWTHDVEGYSPNFTENAKSFSIGLNADYSNKYTASINYTNFFDGKYNTMVDRDFAAVTFGVSF